MMQEGVNADGGYAVPEDIVTAIIDRRDSKESLLGEVRVVKVNNQERPPHLQEAQPAHRLCHRG